MIGDNVTIGYNITFDIGATATLLIGDGVNLTQDIIISAVERVEIGKYCLVAENVSIRDANHGTSRVKNINTQGLCSAPIKINDDVWLGAGVKVLKGATIAEGCIIGSNGIVLESSKCHDYKIYAGAPIREIGERD